MSKFLAMLISRSLYFTACSRLEDRFEGTMTHLSSLEESYHGFSSWLNSWRDSIYVNCWHMSESESAAMWKLYLPGGDGIAIQSTVGRLKSCLTKEEGCEIVSIAPIAYIDYKSARISNDNLLRAYFSKRQSFDYERELRMLFVASGPETWNIGGIYVDIIPEKLIETIRVAPGSATWLHNLVKEVSIKYLTDVPSIMTSGLDERPFEAAIEDDPD